MKRLILLISLFVGLISTTVAQSLSITQDKALAIVKKFYIGQDVDYYLCTERSVWKIFVNLYQQYH